jgi:membrane-associated phospholipid phosphatase
VNQAALTARHVKWLLSGLLGSFLLSPPASAQIGPGPVLLSAPSASSHSEVTEYDGSPDGPAQKNKIQNSSSSDRIAPVLLKRAWADQKGIYSAPFHRHNLKWDALFLAATGALIATDKHVTGAIPSGNISISQHISDAGFYSTVGTTGILLVSGILKKNEHAQETGILAFEAFGNTLAVDAVTQLVAGRERPLEGSGHGRFWVNNNVTSALPSMHSSLAWSLASVLAHEYPSPWVQLLAYGTATTVSVTRVTGLKHFPADVAVGGVFGYFIGQQIFHRHSRLFQAHHDHKIHVPNSE